MKIIIISLCIVNKYSLKNKNNLIYKKLWMVQKNTDFKFIKVNPIAGAIGAEIDNVNLSSNLEDEILKEIYSAFLSFNVIFFRNQKFEPKSQKEFANRIGKPIIYPFVKDLSNFQKLLQF